MRKLQSNTTLHEELNRAYAAFNPKTDDEPYQDRVLAFSNFAKFKYGLELRLFARINDSNQLAYELKEVYVVNEKKFTLFLMEWA